MVNDLSNNNKLRFGTCGTTPRPRGTKTRVWVVPFPLFPLERESERDDWPVIFVSKRGKSMTDKPDYPKHWKHAGTKAKGTNPKALGTNPRALGTNPRALGTNPKALGTNERALARNRWALRNWKRAQRKFKQAE